MDWPDELQRGPDKDVLTTIRTEPPNGDHQDFPNMWGQLDTQETQPNISNVSVAKSYANFIVYPILLAAVCVFVGMTIYGMIDNEFQAKDQSDPTVWIRFGIFVVILIVFVYSQYKYRQGWSLLISTNEPMSINILYAFAIIFAVVLTVAFSLVHFRVWKLSTDVSDIIETVCVVVIAMISFTLVQTVSSAKMAVEIRCPKHL